MTCLNITLLVNTEETFVFIEFCVSGLMAMWLLNSTLSNFGASFNFYFVLGIMTKHVQLRTKAVHKVLKKVHCVTLYRTG